VQDVFDNRPEPESKRKVPSSVELVVIALGSHVDSIHDARSPDGGNHPPWGLGERLEEVSEQRRRLAALVVARAMNLVKVELLGEATEPDLREEGPAQIKKLVPLVIAVDICILAQVLGAGHSGSRVDVRLAVGSGIAVGHLGSSIAVGISIGLAISMTIGGLFGNEEADQRVIEDVVCGFGVLVGIRILEDVFDIAAGVVEDKISAAGVIIGEIGHIVDLVANGDVAGSLGVVCFDLGTGEGWKGSRRHVEAAVEITSRWERVKVETAIEDRCDQTALN